MTESSLLSEGSRLGPYEITGRIGAGGMGEVFRAHAGRVFADRLILSRSSAAVQPPETHRVWRLTRRRTLAGQVQLAGHPRATARTTSAAQNSIYQ